MEEEMRFRTRRWNLAIKDNSLSIVLFVLFVICISAQVSPAGGSKTILLRHTGGRRSAIGVFCQPAASRGPRLELAGSRPTAWVADLFSSFLFQRARRIPRSAGCHASICGTRQTALAGSTEIRCQSRFCFSSCSRSLCMSFSAPVPTTRNAGSQPAAHLHRGISVFG